MTKGEHKMPTKELVKEEIFSAADFRLLSQKAIIEKAQGVEKLGVFSNNNLALAMMDWGKYESMVNLINDLIERVDKYESFLEDVELEELYGKDVEKVESGEVKSYVLDDSEDLLAFMDRRHSK